MLRSNLFLTILLIIGLLSGSANAIQTIYVEGDSKFSASISAKEANRIKIENDRIKSIKANSGEVTISKEEKLGEVYVKPNRGLARKPINLFIITEKGYTYQALLLPKSIPSEQIILRNDSASLSANASPIFESKGSYRNKVIELLKAMRVRAKIEGYTMRKSKRYVDLGDIEIKRVLSYRPEDSSNLSGEIFVFKNDTKQLIQLEEKMFFKDGVRAIKIEKSTLLPKETTEIFIVS